MLFTYSPTVAASPAAVIGTIVMIGFLCATAMIAYSIFLRADERRKAAHAAHDAARSAAREHALSAPSMQALKELPAGSDSRYITRIAVDAVRLLDQGVNDPLFTTTPEYSQRAEEIVEAFYGRAFDDGRDGSEARS